MLFDLFQLKGAQAGDVDEFVRREMNAAKVTAQLQRAGLGLGDSKGCE